MGLTWIALALTCVALSGACARSAPRRLAAGAGTYRVFDVNRTALRAANKRGPKPPAAGGGGALVQNGQLAAADDFPYFASLTDSEGEWAGCGGALIRRRAVLTAAHCVTNDDGTLNNDVYGAYINILTWYDDDGDFYEYRDIKRIVLPNYNPVTSANDMAILILDRNVRTAPVALARRTTTIRRGETLYAPGFGGTESSDSTDELRYASLPFLPTNVCNSIYTNQLDMDRMPSSHICAGWNTDNQDTCTGDSGGPLIKVNNGKDVLVGVTSYGAATDEFGCTGDANLGAYTSVRAMRPWIDRIIRKFRL